jgi:hypothetical protein
MRAMAMASATPRAQAARPTHPSRATTALVMAADRGRTHSPPVVQGLRPGAQCVAQFGSPLGMQCFLGYSLPEESW